MLYTYVRNDHSGVEARTPARQHSVAAECSAGAVFQAPSVLLFVLIGTGERVMVDQRLESD
eukprot:4157864-Lingulodinium_polyedra.AAC.1